MKSEERERGDSIVIELQRAASNSSIRTSDLLRKALLVAMKLKIIDQEPWIQSELNGYSDADTNPFPPYRLLDGEIQRAKSDYALSRRVLFFESAPGWHHDSAKQQACTISVAEIEGILNGNTHDNKVDIPCSPYAKELESELGPLVLTVQASSLHCILDAVRTRIFNWALTLEEKGINGENLQFSDEPMKSEHADSAEERTEQTGIGRRMTVTAQQPEPILPGWRRGKLVLRQMPNGKTPAVFAFGRQKYTVPSGKAWSTVCDMIQADAFDGHGIKMKTPSNSFKRAHRGFFIDRMTKNDSGWFIRTQ